MEKLNYYLNWFKSLKFSNCFSQWTFFSVLSHALLWELLLDNFRLYKSIKERGPCSPRHRHQRDWPSWTRPNSLNPFLEGRGTSSRIFVTIWCSWSAQSQLYQSLHSDSKTIKTMRSRLLPHLQQVPVPGPLLVEPWAYSDSYQTSEVLNSGFTQIEHKTFTGFHYWSSLPEFSCSLTVIAQEPKWVLNFVNCLGTPFLANWTATSLNLIPACPNIHFVALGQLHQWYLLPNKGLGCFISC